MTDAPPLDDTDPGYYFWWFKNEATGKEYLSGWRMQIAYATVHYPGARPKLSDREIRHSHYGTGHFPEPCRCAEKQDDGPGRCVGCGRSIARIGVS